MKIEQLIVQYLYQNKEVTLQGIGTFKLNPQIELPTDTTKDNLMPEDAFEYEDNHKATPDAGLLDYIVKSGKLRSLAISDIDSYITLSKQFLNIGNPMVIDGVGTLQRDKMDNYLFAPGRFVNAVINNGPKEIKERKDEIVSFRTKGKNYENDTKKSLLLIIAAAVFIIFALGIYFIVAKKNDPPIAPATFATLPIIDTVAKKATVILPKPDTAIAPKPIVTSIKDSTTTTSLLNETSTFKIVLHKFNTATAAEKELQRLKSFGYKVNIQKRDSTSYLIVMPFNRPLIFSHKIKDSISALLGCNGYILENK